MPVTKSNIDIIKYSFSDSGAINRSAITPDIVEEIAGDILPTVAEWIGLDLPQKTTPATKSNGLKNLDAVTDAVKKQGSEIIQSIALGRTPLTLGGEHSQGIATLKATILAELTKAILNKEIAVNSQLETGMFYDKLEKNLKAGDAEAIANTIRSTIQTGHIQPQDIQKFTEGFAVIWIDAHPDYNDAEISGSGHIHGMPLAVATGRKVGGLENLFGGDFIKINPENCYVLCARDIDDDERAILKEDGIQFEEWELTTPGAMRTPEDPDNPITLKSSLDDVMSRIGDKRIILSVDIDGFHAAPHKSKYGIESVATTGTPMGFQPKDLNSTFGKAANRNGNTPETLIRKNINDQSPAGPSISDAYEALQNILSDPRIVAADLSEISPFAGEEGKPIAEKDIGASLKTGIRVLAAMTGEDLDKFAKELDAKQTDIDYLIKQFIKLEINQPGLIGA